MADHKIVYDELQRTYTLNGEQILAERLELFIRQAYYSGQTIEMESVDDFESLTNTDPKQIYNNVLFDALANTDRRGEYGDLVEQVIKSGIPRPTVLQAPILQRQVQPQDTKYPTQVFQENENASNLPQESEISYDQPEFNDASRFGSPVTNQETQIPGGEKFVQQTPVPIQPTQIPLQQSQPGTAMLTAEAHLPSSGPHTPRGTIGALGGSPPPSLQGSAGGLLKSLPGWLNTHPSLGDVFGDDSDIIPKPYEANESDHSYEEFDSRLVIPDSDSDEPLVVGADGGSESPPITPRSSESPPQSSQGTRYAPYSSFPAVITESPQASQTESSASSEFTQAMEPVAHTPGPFTRAARAASLQSNSTPENLSSQDSDPIVIGEKVSVQNPVRHSVPPIEQAAEHSGKPPRAPRPKGS